MHQTLRDNVTEISRELGFKARNKEIQQDLNRLVSAYILKALKNLGWRMTLGECVSTQELARQLGIVNRHHRLLHRLLGFLAEDRIIQGIDGSWNVVQQPVELDIDTVWRPILHRFPANYPELALLASCGEKLDQVLNGTVDPLQLIFPEGSLVTAEHLYQDAPSFKIYNILVARAISLALENLPDGRIVRLLEIGGGTAGTTSYVLSKLPVEQTQYVFTDVTAHFLHKAEQKFRDYPCMKYEQLDIEKDPEEQGFEPHSFDIILVSDVLHATSDLRTSLDHVKELLASGGLLVLLETDNPARWVDLVFGLTEGWWRFTDFDLRTSYPLLTREQWLNLLAESGFTQADAFSEMEVHEGASQVVFTARGPVFDVQPRKVETKLSSPSDRKQWLIFADHSGTANDLAARLRARGDTCMMLSHCECYQQIGDEEVEISLTQPQDLQRILDETVKLSKKNLYGVIHCWSLDSKPIHETTLESLQESTSLGCVSIMNLVQALAHLHDIHSPKLFIIAQGAQPAGSEMSSVAVAQSPVLGLGRVIMNEHQTLRCRMIDLSNNPSEVERQSLYEEIINGDVEDEIALRGSARFVQRLVRTSLRRSAHQEKKSVLMHQLPARLESASSGVLENLTLRETSRRLPGRGEVEIQVAAAAMNFRDVMKALGLYPIETDEDMLLGDECTGKVVKCGEGVTHLRAGDEVIAIAAGCYSSFITVDASNVMRKPAQISFEEAVTIPVAFLTAYYALHHVGRMTKGERVLIHAATGGVGLAALQIARHAGADIFATAGTTEKRAFLRSMGVNHVMDSRSLMFADEVMAATENQGVDIVLNSLAGKAISKGLACLAPYGRFLELGKRDIHFNTKVGLRNFKNNISFSAIYLKSLMGDKPELVKRLLDECMELFRERIFHPLPYRAFPIGDAVNAFRHMAQAKHIGKIILTMQNQEVAVEPHMKESLSFSPEATYLITGGLGGFGLTVARWMVDHGARNLVLLGRSGSSSDEARGATTAMRDQGANIVVVSADVTRHDDIARVLEDIRQHMPPLRGVVHAAMVLDDGILLQMTAERFRKVMAPKVLGAWNLHTLTQPDNLDFFVMFSSVTTMAGNPGQGNYVAANSFLDALAHHRRKQNLPALTVNWGHISDVGYVAKHRTVAEHLDTVGLKGFTSKQALTVLGQLLLKGLTHVGVMDIDWRQWGKYASAQQTPRFSRLIDIASLNHHRDSDGIRIRDRVLSAPSEERLQLIEAYLTEQVARVLGTSSAKLEGQRRLNEMGLDSLMMVELKNRLEKELGISIPTVELMRGPSIKKLAHVLDVQLNGTAAPAAGRENKVKTDTTQEISSENAEELLQKVDYLSDREVDSLLDRLVGEGNLNKSVNNG
jgi:NADPH:quinone reductase-like Zn-dependent oxidoreductase/SAM-dependent methyltransferase/acyl carrier protein